MIPKIIHKTSNTRTWEELHVIKRAKKMMPDFQHIFWTDNDNLELVKQVFPQYVEAYRSIERGVVRADITRCLYLYLKGGIYCDTDYLFYRPLDDKFLSHRCVLGIEQENQKEVGGGYKVGNAFMASQAGLPLWRDFVESIFMRISQSTCRIKQEGNGTHHQEMSVLYLSGPHALSIFLKEHKEYESQVTFLPAATVYPTLRWRGLSAIKNEYTIGVHLVWGRWRNIPIMESIKQRIRRWGSAAL